MITVGPGCILNSPGHDGRNVLWCNKCNCHVDNMHAMTGLCLDQMITEVKGVVRVDGSALQVFKFDTQGDYPAPAVSEAFRLWESEPDKGIIAHITDQSKAWLIEAWNRISVNVESMQACSWWRKRLLNEDRWSALTKNARDSIKKNEAETRAKLVFLRQKFMALKVNARNEKWESRKQRSLQSRILTNTLVKRAQE